MVTEVKEVIWLIWKNESGETFKIGELEKKPGKYYFKYDIEGVKRAREYEFTLLPNFPKVEAEYFREDLFNAFANRIDINGKKEMNSILKQYELDKFDAFEFLKRSGGKTSNDTLEFVLPTSEELIS